MDSGRATEDVVHALEKGSLATQRAIANLHNAVHKRCNDMIYVAIILVAALGFLMICLAKPAAADAEYTCSQLVTATGSAWGKKIAIAGARKDLQSRFDDPCVTENATYYVERIRIRCLGIADFFRGKPTLEEAKDRALEDVITACNILQEKEDN